MSLEFNIDKILKAYNIDADVLKQSVDFLEGMDKLLPTPNKNDGEHSDQNPNSSNDVTNVSYSS